MRPMKKYQTDSKKNRNPYAKVLINGLFRQRILKNKKIYSRKGKNKIVFQRED